MGNSGLISVHELKLIWALLPISEPAEGRFVHELAHCLYLSGSVSPPPSRITPARVCHSACWSLCYNALG